MYTSNLNAILSDITSVTTTPVTNYLRPNAFRFVIQDIPKVAYTCQSANLPALQIGFVQQPTPFIDIPRIGDKLTYGELVIRFLISEDMSNYLELFEWLVALGFPNDYNQYKAFTGERLGRFPFIRDPRGGLEIASYSDATLTILDSNNNPKTNIRFRDLFPISLEGLDFDASSPTLEYFVGVAAFKYKTFEVEPL